ncbi:UDP-N-acetylmuramoyl-L-alanyl-D-glutamate--2,6-diaminopimelate ligase [Parasporobacterium paucivorans]|uniref:UDP-N-acetylmuramyl-tripeptide synthetase n=1 Tax=Parasporobacterium paucivorans DSM 15970 TaxID=1122934 RepID=A0A1M6ESP7_9FIRM|nr:UDP-N-acetylmuramoyl-L-alanyl-D-glutamate--2,6-diaminopimelate ligase [Parasporobacterium paucivorans]SHI88492.1 UDP-N-acetylmuramoylalanyl-D-glutamate--2,6-diaminopimelate ligase [Parasporobacterium paucivorans DSM 15970]
MRLSEILEKCEYTCKSEINDAEISDVIYDSRKVVPGCVFVCLVGASSDGHAYAADAVLKGAAAIIAEREMDLPDGCVPIIVENSRQALSYISAAFFRYPADELTTIALTGTKGKTTISFMIKDILEKAGKKAGIIGTMGVFTDKRHIETHNTTPESYEIQKYLREMADEGCKYAVMEVSSQALMVGRTAGIVFDFGLFSNISPDHIGENEHKDYGEYLRCKKILFSQCRQGLFNIDDKHAEYMMEDATCSIHTYGFRPEAGLRAAEVHYLRDGGFIGIKMRTEGTVADEFLVGMPGKFTAYNAMAAIGITFLCGIDTLPMKEALHDVLVTGRMENVRISDKFTLLIDYAHNAMSMESILTTMRDYNPKRMVSLFGCGGNRSKLRRFEMGEISGRLADLSILTADNSRFEDVNDIIADILTGMHKTNGEYVVIPDRKEAIKYSIQNAREGDIILLLGKGHEDYQEIKGERYPFDERVVIKDILEEIGWQ